jgi:hypothetical protein
MDWMETSPPDKQARREAAFQRLGVERVRAAMLSGGWPREKRDAARAWLDHQDASAWQEKRADGSNGSAILRFRGARWWWLAAPGVAAAGFARILVQMHVWQWH